MGEIEELYQEIVMQHNRAPKNFHSLGSPNRSAEGFNPFCGDQVTIELILENDVINDIGFQGSGCAISKSSASMMTDAVKTKTSKEAEEIFTRFHEMMTSGSNDEGGFSDLGDLELLAGVSMFPTRIKCATLSWHALLSALKSDKHTVSSE